MWLLRANQPTSAACALVRSPTALAAQACRDARGESHADGWGIAHYRDGQVIVERGVTAAFNDQNFRHAAERVQAQTVLAHVRQASIGTVSLANTHPFVYGRWLFAHNGTITAFEQIRKELERETLPRFVKLKAGTTDSECAFYWFLSRMKRSGIDPDAAVHDVSALVQLTGEAVRRLAAQCEGVASDRPFGLNFFLTDGTVLIASRWGRTLWWLSHASSSMCEICGRPHAETPATQAYCGVEVASEPTSDDAWLEAPDQSIVAIDHQLQLRVASL